MKVPIPHPSLGYLDFILEAGLALVQPIHAGTFERNDGHTLQRWQSPNSQRDLVFGGSRIWVAHWTI
jgi:hypothetical protein